jgi:hypoxanthine phosphoribosyltransferase
MKRLDWNDIAEFTKWIGPALRSLKEPMDRDYTGVYGIPRGGLIPAVIISNLLNIPLLASPRDGCIVVDDIVDTGSTIKPYTFSHHDRKVTTVTIAQKTTAEFRADLAFTEITPDDGWVKFPWEGDHK